MSIPAPTSDSALWAGRPVAISGATGFIGYHTCVALAAAGAKISALVRASSDVSHLRPLGVEIRVAPLDKAERLTAALHETDLLFHLAGAVDFNNEWEQCRRVNVAGTANILRAARQSGVRRVVHASSIVAVGASTCPERLDESASWNLGGARVPYVTTKWEGEQLALGLREGPEVVVVNPASVIGPKDFAGSEFGTLCHRFWRGRIPLIFGGGNNFVDVRDVAAGMLLAATSGRPGERYILGGTNRSYTAFHSDLAGASDRVIPRLRVPTNLARVGAAIGDRVTKKRHKRPLLTAAQARLLGFFFYYDCSKAQRELGYTTRPLRDTIADSYRFWMADRRGRDRIAA